jgi:hypothetical protein
VRNWRASPGVPINHRIVLALHFGAVRCAAPAVTNSLHRLLFFPAISPHREGNRGREIDNPSTLPTSSHVLLALLAARVGLVSLVGSDNFDLHALGCCTEILHGELCRKPPISQ